MGCFTPASPYGGAAHTCFRLPGRRPGIVTQEIPADGLREGEKAVRVPDLRAETTPGPVATFPSLRTVDPQRGGRFGPHNVHENRPGNHRSEELIFVTSVNAGLRVVDISDLYRPEEVAWFVPPAPPGSRKGAPQINEVSVPPDGFVYCADLYMGGLYILELMAVSLRREDPRSLWAPPRHGLEHLCHHEAKCLLSPGSSQRSP